MGVPSSSCIRKLVTFVASSAGGNDDNSLHGKLLSETISTISLTARGALQGTEKNGNWEK